MTRPLIAAALLALPFAALATDYGAPMPQQIDAVPLATVLESPDAKLDQTVTVRGRIASVCQKEGCWIVLADGEHTARVMTRHNFFVPKDSTGEAIAIGKLAKRELDADAADHLSKDGGKDQATLAAGTVEWRVLADSIRIVPAG